jgi:transcriptional regulator with XRE-family HTH domain
MRKSEVIRSFRKEMGWNQQRLAEFLGVSLSIVGKWERNERTPTNSVIAICLIAEHLQPPEADSADPLSFRRFLASHLSNRTK